METSNSGRGIVAGPFASRVGQFITTTLSICATGENAVPLLLGEMPD